MTDYLSCEPNLGNFTKSLLSIGYTHYTAILDIIDNSIAAGSTKIWIDYHISGPKKSMVISDNGFGMSDSELFEAMRMASADPMVTRESASDLGKFGLGLKLASFSQTDKFQVISKRENDGYYSYCWDLNTVRKENKWLIQRIKQDHFSNDIDRTSGTDVVLHTLRGFGADIDNERIIGRLYYHLASVYHLISGVEFYLNRKKVIPIDPFFVSPAANSTSYESISHLGINLMVRSYQVPHRDNLSNDKRIDFDALKDIGMSDGIYLYRKNRLIAWSGWEGLSSNKRIADLHRLAVFINEDADDLFNIEVKKSQISILDDALRKKIMSKIKIFSNTAKRPYKKRAELSLKDIADLWTLTNEDNKVSFALNKKSAIIKRFNNNEISVNDFVDLIEGTLPIDSILYYLNTEKIDREDYRKKKYKAAKVLLELGLITNEELKALE